MTLDKLPDDKGEKHGAVIDMTWHRKRREAQFARVQASKRGAGKPGAVPLKIRAAWAFQLGAVLFGLAILLKGCGLF
jgi:hypothetical protein